MFNSCWILFPKSPVVILCILHHRHTEEYRKASITFGPFWNTVLLYNSYSVFYIISCCWRVPINANVYCFSQNSSWLIPTKLCRWSGNPSIEIIEILQARSDSLLCSWHGFCNILLLAIFQFANVLFIFFIHIYISCVFFYFVTLNYNKKF